MGVLNVTADSFSDGGRYLRHDAAVGHGLDMQRLGVDVIDVGGESTRPGAQRVDAAVEAARVTPVIADLAAGGMTISVDTMRASVAAAAVEAGAAIVNDVSGGLADPDMARVVAEAGVPWILMHWRADGGYVHAGGAAHRGEDVVETVVTELLRQVDAAVAAGVDPGKLVLDPGLGFAKTGADNWALLDALPRLTGLGFPVLIGASRKRFLGELLAGPDGAPRSPDGREVATAAISALAAAGGAWGVRVHDVLASLDAVAVATRWHQEGQR
ncbi:dihydropteroate synthase [Rhodococcus sp. D2-41]|uniref:Dihydropteroate synthase n=1 Tax=Speluncibacter jeojiensis TaxID=2710754 RepID=A0A9X4M2L4_9ACTN|nr:dihydropteroate synthase [Rhodococcus sp. D2-41]MDG3009308.1 dihydropteroate synthase [Rhodococcus sp. D2-41]MDG3016905.1 dihydropteroate synthase [Corynebacteriales bacterium D3-21]